MPEYARKIGRIDRLALGLSALCGAHCLATSLLIGVMASLGGILDSPLVHEVGLALAIILGALALGAGTFRHRNLLPFVIGSAGLAVMASALALPHGAPETAVTLLGVAILSVAHLLNRQAAARA
jgi:hypothetical protein